MSTANNLYITLQYLRTTNNINKYHWALYATGPSPPKGYLLHATDEGRQPLDLYYAPRSVSNPMKSKTMVACLKIASSPDPKALDAVAKSIHLMDRRYLPANEPQWTCRVWVKELLSKLHDKRYIVLPMGVDGIERYCQDTADGYIRYMGNAKVINDTRWLTGQTMPMDVDSTGYYGSSAMDTETGGYYGSSAMDTRTERGGNARSSRHKDGGHRSSGSGHGSGRSAGRSGMNTGW
jgi:hypothetical protein